jgi:hypothetical protein
VVGAGEIKQKNSVCDCKSKHIRSSRRCLESRLRCGHAGARANSRRRAWRPWRGSSRGGVAWRAKKKTAGRAAAAAGWRATRGVAGKQEVALGCSDGERQ